MKKIDMFSNCMASRTDKMFLFPLVGLFISLLSPALICGQSDPQGQSPSNSKPGYGQGQSYTQGQTQAPVQSPGVGPGDSDSISTKQIIQIVNNNPDFAEEAKSIVADRLREEGRTAPGGQLSPSFMANELQTDSELKSRLLVAIERRGLLPQTVQASQIGKNGNLAPKATSGASGKIAGNTAPRALPSRQMGIRDQLTTTGQQPHAALADEEPTKPEFLEQPSPYGDLESLRDLYTQIPENTTDLKRFGIDVFLNGSGNVDLLPVDLPAGPDYVLGSGDELTIHIWGGMEQSFSEPVDRSGRIILPGTASVMVASCTMAQAQEAIRTALSRQFKNMKVDVSLTRVRSVRIYVVGDVRRPGAYDISSLSTPLNALFAAGGPTEQGSLRRVKHYRGDKLVADVDLYGLLLNGISKDLSRLESGDTILVPPVGAQVVVAGMVKRPSIYEMNDGEDLAKIIDLAGGLKVSATLGRITIDRVEEHKRRVTMNLQVPDAAEKSTIGSLLSGFHVQDGDRITIFPILPYREETVYVEGHVYRPGKHAFEKGMQVSDLIHSYQDLLPEPSERAEIIRLVPPEYRPVVIEFRLSEALTSGHPLYLQPFDTVRTFGRYEFDAPKVTINGEVLLPGEYPMARDMTAVDLVRIAGGFKRSAYTDKADIASYIIQNGTEIVTEHKIVNIAEAMKGNASEDVTLKAGDVVTIRQLTGWEDIGASVTVSGEVEHSGTYGIGTSEKLSKLLERAGGFRSTAFPEGAVLERVQVRELAEKSQQELIARIEMQGLGKSGASSSLATGQEQQAQLQAMMEQQKQVVEALRSHPPNGRLVINISSDISRWKDTPSDVEVRAGDVITIPKRSDLIMVNGQVYNPSAMTVIPGRTAEWYLHSAGGFTELANKHATFIIRANGSVISNGGGRSGHNVLSTRLKAGDIVIVPEKVVGGSSTWRNLINAAQVISGVAITARVATSF